MKKLTYLFLALIIVASSAESSDSGLEQDWHRIREKYHLLIPQGLDLTRVWLNDIGQLWNNDQLEFKGNFRNDDVNVDGLIRKCVLTKTGS